MSDPECPNCGGADVIDVAPGLQSRAYRVSALTPPQAPLNLARCPDCSYQNQPGARYCNQRGLTLASWTAIQKPKTDPALLSIAATVVGSMFLPVGGAVLGLFLGYKARDLARATVAVVSRPRRLLSREREALHHSHLAAATGQALSRYESEVS